MTKKDNKIQYSEPINPDNWDVEQVEWGPKETKVFLRDTFMKMKPDMLNIMKMDMPIGMNISLIVDEKEESGYRSVLTETYQNIIYMVELGLLKIEEDVKKGLVWEFTLGPGVIYDAMTKYLRGEL